MNKDLLTILGIYPTFKDLYVNNKILSYCNDGIHFNRMFFDEMFPFVERKAYTDKLDIKETTVCGIKVYAVYDKESNQ